MLQLLLFANVPIASTRGDQKLIN